MTTGECDPMPNYDGEKKRLFILPVDPSKHSERAFDWYLRNIHKPQDKVEIVHIHEIPTFDHEAFGVWGKFYDNHSEYKKAVQKSIESSKLLLKKFEEKAVSAGVDHESILKLNQHGAGHVICDVASVKNADGIIMGSRGLNLVRRTLLGSVSSYVLNHSDKTVTIIPPEDAHKQYNIIVPRDDTDITNMF